MFLALLLNSFATDSLQNQRKAEMEGSKVKQGWNRLKGLFKKPNAEAEVNKKPSIANILEELKKRQAEQAKANG